jgi:hypothetical protein
MCNERRQTGWALARYWSGALLVAIALVSLAACGGESSEKPPAPLERGSGTVQDRVPGEYVITVRSGGDADLLRDLYEEYGVRDVSEIGPDLFLLKLKEDPGVDEIRRKGIESGKVSAVQPNFIYRGFVR